MMRVPVDKLGEIEAAVKDAGGRLTISSAPDETWADVRADGVQLLSILEKSGLARCVIIRDGIEAWVLPDGSVDYVGSRDADLGQFMDELVKRLDHFQRFADDIKKTYKRFMQA